MDDVHKETVKKLASSIEQALEDHLPLSELNGTSVLNDAIRYSVFSGGKRMRPVLTLVAADLVGLNAADAKRLAASMEYLHTASLILDDLPCMDDTSERRGKSSAHIEFGEPVAVMAAMALLNQTYALLAGLPNGADLVKFACECIGHRGMVAGQTIDLVEDFTDRTNHREDHYMKTTALFRMALVAPAVAAGAKPHSINAFSNFGHCAGMGYQLVDDAHDLDDDKAWIGQSAAQMLRSAEQWVEQAKSHIMAGFAGTRGAKFLSAFADWLLADAQTEASH
ncbi:MAG: polyprenyl synthetase family protein [Planctomycetota bacterium]|jgi:geranylgeranyl pyrophosphate synthase